MDKCPHDLFYEGKYYCCALTEHPVLGSSSACSIKNWHECIFNKNGGGVMERCEVCGKDAPIILCAINTEHENSAFLNVCVECGMSVSILLYSLKMRAANELSDKTGKGWKL